jgi:DNA-binding winged helix-turn-helix (wHTH) protein/Tol biopolymer transport system component
MGLVRDGKRAAVFGPFSFDLSTRELRKNGLRTRLEEKPALVLRRLIERAGAVVTREELQTLLWPTGVHVDFSHGLNKSINRLRAVLADDRDQPRYIETLSRRGYRFIAQVEFVTEPQIVEEDESIDSIIQPINLSAELPNPGISGTLSPLEPLRTVEPPSANGMTFRSKSVIPTTVWRAGLATAAALLLIGLVLRVAQANRSAALRLTHSAINLPSELRLATTSENLGLALSPDGTQMVFSAAGSNGQPQLWLRPLDSPQTMPIPGTEGGAFPFWSPDAKDLGFFVGTELRRVTLADHRVKTLCAVESGRGGSWSSEGTILFSPGTRGPIYRISSSGGIPSPVTVLDESHFTTHRWPEFLPDGRHFVYLAANHEKSWAPGAIFLGSLDGGQAKLLGESDSNVVSLSGSLLFLSRGKLISQSVVLESGALESRADIIADAVEYDPGLWYGSFTATTTGVLYRPRREETKNNTISWFDRKGNRLGDAGPSGIYRDMSLAPDGRTIATACGDPATNVCLIHADGTVTQITHSGINGEPVWADDSTFFSYYAHQGSTDHAIVVKPLDESTSGHVVKTASASIVVSSWHHDKRHSLLVGDVGDGKFQYFIFDLASYRMTPYLSPDPSLSVFARFSPDGNWIAYSKNAAGKDEIHIVSYPVPSLHYAVANAEGRGPKWRGDGRELFFLRSDGNLQSVSVSHVNDGLAFGAPQILFHPPIPPAPWDIGSFDVTRDGTKFLVNTVPATEPSRLVLTTNWQP